MPTKRKTIDTFVVEIEEIGYTISELLNMLHDVKLEESVYKDVRFKVIQNTDEYLLASVESTKKSGIPPKRNSNTQDQAPLPLADDEGLGYSNVLLLSKRHNVIMYEFNKEGCYVPSLLTLLNKAFRERENPINAGFKFSAFLRPEAFRRMLGMDKYKTIELKVANPQSIIQEYLDENDAISSAINSAKELDSDSVWVKFDVNYRRMNGMPSERLQNLIRRVTDLINISDERVVEKCTLTGYRQDPDEEHPIKDDIDLLVDKYKKQISVEEPRLKSDTQTTEKSAALLNLYYDCNSDFDILNN